MTFHVGQKVVCIKRGSWANEFGAAGDEVFPSFGEVYTIRRIEDGRWLLLVEIVNRLREYGDGELGEARFCASRFRPVVERKTDIGFAHEILRKVSRKHPVRA
jgi:hypothetical protein